MLTPERERDIYIRAEAAYRALCRLEDALDALDPEDELGDAARTLNMLLHRWDRDTERKITRELDRRGIS